MRFDPLSGLLLCPICRRDWSGSAGCCRRCRSGLFRPLRLPALTALGFYRGDLRRALLAYKFQGMRRLAPIFAEALASAIRERRWGPAVVSHVPLHHRRLRSRGYDQARLLAGDVAGRLQLPLRDSLERTRDTPQQARLSARERQGNVRGAFRPLGSQPAVVLLIDDVLTTGATLAACRTALEGAGARMVLSAVLALAPPPQNPAPGIGRSVPEPGCVRSSRRRRW